MTWRPADERPPWCPHPTCTPRAGFNEQVCIGELPRPEPHGLDENTHRLCLHGAKDDGEWTFDLQVNRGDAWHLWRLLALVWGFR